jgi:hypothetical protein
MQAKQIELGPAKHQPFLELQTVHLSLNLPVVLGRREGSAHDCVIATNACGKALEFDNPALFGLHEPAIQITASPLSQHHHKPLAEVVRRFQVGMTCSDVVDVQPLLLIELGGPTDEEPGGTCGGYVVLESGIWRQSQGQFDRRPSSIKGESACLPPSLV